MKDKARTNDFSMPLFFRTGSTRYFIRRAAIPGPFSPYSITLTTASGVIFIRSYIISSALGAALTVDVQ